MDRVYVFTTSIVFEKVKTWIKGKSSVTLVLRFLRVDVDDKQSLHVMLSLKNVLVCVSTIHRYEIIGLQAPQSFSSRSRWYMWNLYFMVTLFKFLIQRYVLFFMLSFCVVLCIVNMMDQGRRCVIIVESIYYWVLNLCQDFSFPGTFHPLSWLHKII